MVKIAWLNQKCNWPLSMALTIDTASTSTGSRPWYRRAHYLVLESTYLNLSCSTCTSTWYFSFPSFLPVPGTWYKYSYPENKKRASKILFQWTNVLRPGTSTTTRVCMRALVNHVTVLLWSLLERPCVCCVFFFRLRSSAFIAGAWTPPVEQTLELDNDHISLLKF